MRRPLLAVVVPVCAIAVGATGCSALGGSTGGSSADGKTTTITLYNGQHEQTTQDLVAAFEKQNPSIKVNIRSDDEDALAQQIRQEGAKSPADVFYTENSPALESLQASGLLAPASGAALAAVPAKYDSPAGGSGGRDWVGVSARVSVMVVNTGQVPAGQTPTTVLQLADPKWKGRIALAGGETDLQPVVTSVAKAYGTARADQWLAALKANAASHMVPDNETVTSDVDRGQAAIGLVDNYYWYRQAVQDGGIGKTHSKVAYFAAGDPGYVLDVSGAAVLKSSTHKAAAEKFQEFLTSDTAQKIIATSDSFEYPIRPGVAANSELPPLDTLHPNSITVADLGDGSTAVSLLQKAQLL
ncbi:extracellular solute-binding protein [Streptomyces sp. RB6PN25]|uniref:Extracellular solute-binding protein n=1 Tax=Streptomyces humicola TaxID=2953240 RepID=A0ABT1PRG0_9ACTN|nr:extracellular solute-binding protein [Streptomyces humicola]MCQ4079540.1 extracellular solute-binding protein [Streptomyces humicola]